MKINVRQMKIILEMYGVCEVEGQLTEDICEFMSEVAAQLDLAGITVCDCCYKVIEESKLDNIVVRYDTVAEYCDLCIKGV